MWRSRVTDVLVVVVAAAAGLLAARIRSLGPEALPTWALALDVVAGLVACLALWWRRRFPLAVAATAIALGAFSETAYAAALLALFTVAVHCAPRVTAVLTAANLLALTVFFTLRPVPDAVPLWTLVALVLAGHAVVVSWGLLARSRRQLIASLRERAAMAETEAMLRAEHAQHEARETLAREMHDVLGHRLSLLSVHAGALTYHRAASADETAQAAEVIRENAHRALQDLREVIGVLRAPVGELPLPDVTDVGALIEETRRAGTPVELRDEHGVSTAGNKTDPTDPVDATAGRTIYRLVQEALTNARKHAPGAPITVSITGERGDHVVVEITNPPPERPAQGTPGSGEGLRGLRERAALVGGRFEAGPTASGGWKVGMRIPWPA